MSSSNNFINNLRNKPESTKNLIAATLALIPAILVGYAQFYMNAKHSEEKIAEQKQTVEPTKLQAVSAMASIGKIFTEGKSSVDDAFSDLKKIDNEVLKSNNVNESEVKVNSPTDNINTATDTIDVTDSSINVKGTE